MVYGESANDPFNGLSFKFFLHFEIGTTFYPPTNAGGVNNVVKLEARGVAGSGRFGACIPTGPSPAPRAVSVDFQKRIERASGKGSLCYLVGIVLAQKYDL